MKHTMNMKAYDQTNHLENVLVTVSDARQISNSGASVTGFVAIVKSATFAFRKSLGIITCSTIFILTTSCGSAPRNNSQLLQDTASDIRDTSSRNDNKAVYVTAYRIVVGKKYWSRTTPASFLDTLTKYAGNTFFYVEEKPDSTWFIESDLIELRTRCNDTSRSSIVYTSHADHKHDKPFTSTVGKQAIYLIQSFATKNYPHQYSHCSDWVDTTGY